MNPQRAETPSGQNRSSLAGAEMTLPAGRDAAAAPEESIGTLERARGRRMLNAQWGTNQRPKHL
jgi:hypothetical protein